MLSRQHMGPPAMVFKHRKRKAVSSELQTNERVKQVKVSSEDPEPVTQPDIQSDCTPLIMRLPKELQLQILHELVMSFDLDPQVWESAEFMYGNGVGKKCKVALSELRFANLGWDDAICSFLFHHISLPAFSAVDLRAFEQILAKAKYMADSIKMLTLTVWETACFDQLHLTTGLLTLSAMTDLLLSFSAECFTYMGPIKRDNMYAIWFRTMVEPQFLQTQLRDTPILMQDLCDTVLPAMPNLRFITTNVGTPMPQHSRALVKSLSNYDIEEDKLRHFGCHGFNDREDLIRCNAEIAQKVLLQSMPDYILGMNIHGLPIDVPQSKSKFRPILGRQNLIPDRETPLSLQYLRIKPHTRDYLEPSSRFSRSTQRGRFRHTKDRAGELQTFWVHNITQYENLRFLDITSHLWSYTPNKDFIDDLLLSWSAPNLEHLRVTDAEVGAQALAAMLDFPKIRTVKLTALGFPQGENWYSLPRSAKARRLNKRSLAFLKVHLEFTPMMTPLTPAIARNPQLLPTLSVIAAQLLTCEPDTEYAHIDRLSHALTRPEFVHTGIPPDIVNRILRERVIVI